MGSTSTIIKERLNNHKPNHHHNDGKNKHHFRRFLMALVYGVAGFIICFLLLFSLYQCGIISGKSKNGIPLNTLIDGTKRYQFIHDPSDADIVGEIDRSNNLNFQMGDLNISRNVTDDAAEITSNLPQYTGLVSFHWNVSIEIHLDEMITVTDLGYLIESPTATDIQNYIQIANPNANNNINPPYDNAEDLWNSFYRNTTATNLVPSDIPGTQGIGVCQSKPISNQDTNRPFVGSVVVFWEII